MGTQVAPQNTPGDPVAVEFAKIMAVGGVIGVAASLVIATALARLAGLAWGTAFLTAAWPAMVGGPFFGVAFGMVRRFARMDTMTSVAPATAEPQPDPPGGSPRHRRGRVRRPAGLRPGGAASMPSDLLVSKIVHVLAAIVWVGGTVFLAAVAAPALRALPAQERGASMARIGRRFRVVGWGALLLLVATGLHTMARLGLLSAGILTGTPEGRLLLGKLVLVAGILALTGAHDLLLAPAAPRSGRSAVWRSASPGRAAS